MPDHTLEHINTIDIGGRNPVDITVDKENRRVIVATLQGGTLYSIERNGDGSLGKIVSAFTYEGKEPGKVSTIHQCIWDKSMDYLFAAAQGRVNGYGQFRALKYDEETGAFAETSRFMARTWDDRATPPSTPTTAGSTFAKKRATRCFTSSSTTRAARSNALQELSTVPETETGYSDASEVMIDPSGRYVLVSNRYTDSIAVYRIDRTTGYLKSVGFYPCLGKTRAFFCFAPNGRCYVANEDSDTIIEFDFDSSGRLVPTLNVVRTGSRSASSSRRTKERTRMNLGLLSLILLAAAIAVSFLRNVNAGLVSVGFAMILTLVYGDAVTVKGVIAGFNTNLFIQMAGVTYLFAVVSANGTLELTAKKVVNLVPARAIPAVMFFIGMALSASGPGSIPCLAIIPVIAIPLLCRPASTR